jgi:tyrosinase
MSTEHIMIRSNAVKDLPALKKYVEGVKRLKDPAQNPWPGQANLSIYDSFVAWHHRAMMISTPAGQMARNAAHGGPSFLPWHRYFLVRLETLLRKAINDPHFRVPYWDWNTDAELQDPRTSLIWSDEYLGQFVNGQWRVRLTGNGRTMELDGVNRPLVRYLGRGGSLPSRANVRKVIHENPVYDKAPYNAAQSTGGARNSIEGWAGEERIHNNVHVWVGGDMGLSSSPNDPVFFLHHCNVDRLWAAWQAKHPAAAYVPAGNAPDTLKFHRIDDPMYSPFPEKVTPRDVLNYSQYYKYDTLGDLL